MTSNPGSSEAYFDRASTGFTVLAAVLLVFLNLFCYRQTLGGYFLADDYVHVAYLADVFNGHPLKLLENFTGNWMHAWGTQFYRPLISLSLAFDYLVGNGSAMAFHLSNTLFHCAACILLFLVARRLLKEFPPAQRYFCALSAGMLFAVCPLHTEVVSWIIGRVDGICLTFFLSAFYFQLRYKQSRTTWSLFAAIMSFVLALLSKEMAVVLPPLLVFADMVFESGSLLERLRKAFKDSLLFIVVLAAYFGVRTLALGTVAGGYGGSLGEGLSGSALSRFASASKILLPFNTEVISPYDQLCRQLITLYRICAVFLAARFLLLGVSRKLARMAVFCLGWFVLALLPTYQVFNITDSLMCSRFAYFATAPFSLFLAVLLSPLWEKKRPRTLLSVWSGRIAVLLIAAFAFVFAGITVKNNSAWAHAGAHVREFRGAVAKACRQLPGDSRLVLLNTPQRLEGAHMLYNGAMLQVLLSEPLTKPTMEGKVLSFEPPTYGDAELINAGRLKKLLSEKPQYHYCYWDMASRRLIELKLKSEASSRLFDLSSLNKALSSPANSKPAALLSPELNMSSNSCDFVVFTASLFAKAGSSKPAYLTLAWTSINQPRFSPACRISLPAQMDGKEHSYYFAVSEHKNFLSGDVITRLRLEIPDCAGTKLANVQLAAAQTLMPALQPVQLAEANDGIFRLAGDHFQLECDGTKVPDCSGLVLELSKPNSWFAHYAGSQRESRFSQQSLKLFKSDRERNTFCFKRSDFPLPAYYEMRAFAVDRNGKPVGFCSDPIDLQID